MLLLPFVLPVIAIGYLCWFIGKPALAALGFSQLKQSICGDAGAVAHSACERGQRDEYEALLALGFKPLGIYRGTDLVLDDCADEYVFTHKELPVVCALCENVNQELFVVLTTDDHEGRFVKTSSSASAVQSKSHHAFVQAVEAETLEQVFDAHIRALDNWEQQGFQAVHVKTLDAVKGHYLRQFQNPETQNLLRLVYGGAALASCIVSLAFPVAFFMFVPLITNNFSSVALMQASAAISVAMTFWLYRSWHRSQTGLTKIPAENSLRPREQSNADSLEPSI